MSTPDTLYQGEFFSSRQEKTFYSAQKILGIIQSHYPFKSMVDFGCGVGTWLHVADKMGVKNLRGYEGEWARGHLVDNGLDIRFQNFESTIDRVGQFDLAISLEVAEHLTTVAGHALVKSMCASSNVVMFSAAIPGQDGVGHINEQPQEYWQDIFAKFGFSAIDLVRPAIWNDSEIPIWYRQNTLVYTSDKKLHGELSKQTTSIINAVHPEAYEIALNPGVKTSLKVAFSIPRLLLKRLFD